MRRVLLLAIVLSILLTSCLTGRRDDVYIPIGNTGEESLALLEKQYTKRPDSIRVGYDYAYALASVEKYPEAVTVLDELEEKFPTSLRLLYLEAYINEKAGYDNLETLSRIYELDRGDIANGQKLASYHIENGNADEARKLLLDLLRRRPKDDTTLKLLSKIDPFYEKIYVPANYVSSDTDAEVRESKDQSSSL